MCTYYSNVYIILASKPVCSSTYHLPSCAYKTTYIFLSRCISEGRQVKEVESAQEETRGAVYHNNVSMKKQHVIINVIR